MAHEGEGDGDGEVEGAAAAADEVLASSEQDGQAAETGVVVSPPPQAAEEAVIDAVPSSGVTVNEDGEWEREGQTAAAPRAAEGIATSNGLSSTVTVVRSENERSDDEHRRERFSDADYIHISNLPNGVTEESLAALLSEAGSVKLNRAGHPIIKIYKSHKTGELDADVVLEDPKAAKAMISWFNGYDFKGSKIQVSLVQRPPRSLSPQRDSRRGGRGGYRGRGRSRYDSYPSSGGRGGGFGRGFGGRGRGHVDDFRPGDSFGRNNPNVSPREGDWICTEPTCGNLNFARRTACNNCNRPRRDMSPFRLPLNDPPTFRGPPPPFLDGPPVHGLERGMGGFGPPIGMWDRRPFDDFGPPDHFSDRHFHPSRDMRGRDGFDRYDHERDRFERDRFEKPPFDRGFYGGHRDRERDYYHDRGGVHVFREERRPPSPFHPRWGRDFRERSRSPVRRDRYKSEWSSQFEQHRGGGESRRDAARRESQRNGGMRR